MPVQGIGQAASKEVEACNALHLNNIIIHIESFEGVGKPEEP